MRKLQSNTHTLETIMKPIDEKLAAQCKERRRRKRILAARASRAKAGARPRAQSFTATKPWLKDGVSRRTWERRRAARAQVKP
jgi:hypothetical protein